MKVSIIIPSVGRSTLGLVLEALFMNKKFDQIKPEIIVVFDGHNESIKDFKLRFGSDVKILNTAKKVYAGGARNLGIDNATGEVIAFLGDDTIPEQDWLERLFEWHLEFSDQNKALLGRVLWTEALRQDRFHQWLESHAQFDYQALETGKLPTWQHFYTSNISVKKSFLGKERFDPAFEGWGFEDGELGYRLIQKGMDLHYNSDLIVEHDDRQTFEKMLQRTARSRRNALVFERLHSDIKILPRGIKKVLLKLLIVLVTPFVFVPEIRWWRAWKQAWID